jgi:hypothetical protein
MDQPCLKAADGSELFDVPMQSVRQWLTHITATTAAA